MCTTFFKITSTENKSEKTKIKFWIAFNRDISYLRATKRCSVWCDDPNIIGGRDLVRGGSWFLLNTLTGNIAFLTDIWVGVFDHGPKKARGDIVKNFASSDFFEKFEENDILTSIKNFIEEISSERNFYAPFNLVVGNIKLEDVKLFHLVYNTGEILEFKSGSHGLSNSEFSSPFEKIKKNLEILNLMEEDEFEDELRKIMDDETNHGLVGKEEEGGVFVKPYFCKENDGQVIRGTQSQIILKIDFDGNFFLEEKFLEPCPCDEICHQPHKFQKFRRCVQKLKTIFEMKKRKKLKMRKFNCNFEGKIV